MSRARRWWLVFAACNVVIALALVWISRVVIQLERGEAEARAETDYQQSLRLALGRLDAWTALLLAREAARPAAATDHVLLHFEMREDGTLASPEPQRLESYRQVLTPRAVQAAVADAGRQIDAALAAPEAPPPMLAADASDDGAEDPGDDGGLAASVACTVPRPEGQAGGHQVVVWLDRPGPGEPQELAFLAASDDALFRGFLLDWPVLRERLLLEIEDLFPDARLERRVRGAVEADRAATGRELANLPVVLVAERRSPLPPSGLTPARAALGIAWLAVGVAAVAVGLTLRKSIDLGERRRRFVAAVTHELRTPLTTFRMYSEMLADGVVPTERGRREYLQTLKEESVRLSTMVDNVLTHARLEQRRGPRRTESMTLQALLSRLAPALQRRVESTSARLEVRNDGPAEAALDVDADAIGQILGNLVDNAAKYANGTSPARIRLVATAAGGSLVVTVRDHGPGIAREHAATIFEPFVRGGRDPSDPVPGVGLGLALARGLARDLGGELTLESPADGGACFRLELPATA